MALFCCFWGLIWHSIAFYSLVKSIENIGLMCFYMVYHGKKSLEIMFLSLYFVMLHGFIMIFLQVFEDPECGQPNNQCEFQDPKMEVR